MADCRYATPTDQDHGWECEISGDPCMMHQAQGKGCPFLDENEEQEDIDDD